MLAAVTEELSRAPTPRLLDLPRRHAEPGRGQRRCAGPERKGGPARTCLAFTLLVLLTLLSMPAPGRAANESCPEPTGVTREAVRQAVLGWALVRYSELVRDVRVVRVCGEWALAALVPRERVNGAAVVLRFTPDGWTVVAGPGTAFPPERRPPGAPAALFGDDEPGTP